MQDFVHVPVRCYDGLVRSLAVLAGVEVSGIPVPPVMRGVGLLVVVVMQGCFVEQAGPGRDVRRRACPLPAGQPRGDLLQEPAVAVGITERGVGLVGAAVIAEGVRR